MEEKDYRRPEQIIGREKKNINLDRNRREGSRNTKAERRGMWKQRGRKDKARRNRKL